MSAERPTLELGPDRTGNLLVAGGGRVRSFGAGAASGGSGADAGVRVRRLRCPAARIEPGRINAHTHVYSGLAPFGMPAPEPPPESFVEILERVWWRLDRALDEPSLRAAARYYVGEALLAGTTTLIDHHESPGLIEGSLDLLADACQELGMRALLCYGATERNGGREEARRGLEECRRFFVTNRRPLVRGVVGLHASFTVSDETLVEAAALCRELETVMHVHLAEDLADVEDSRRRGYEGPLERLLRFDALPPGSILAHGVHCGAEQVRSAAARRLWIVQNPRSNRGNRVGYPSDLEESERVAVGTDGYPARLDEEAAALAEEANAHGEPAEEVERRLAAGHRLAEERLGLRLAPLAAGGAADAVAVTEDGVEHVVVAGVPVVEAGRLLRADLEEIRAEAGEQAPRLWRRMLALDASGGG